MFALLAEKGRLETESVPQAANLRTLYLAARKTQQIRPI